jgi:putative phosphoesterase
MSQAINFTRINNLADNLKRLKIGVISDTHIADSSKHIPALILEAFRQVDLIIHAGDSVSLGAIEELKIACFRVVAVAGNMDLDEVRNKYPLKQILEVFGYRIGVMHGFGAPAGLLQLLKEAFKEDGCDLIIFGHSHRPLNEKIGNVLFFNPGSATDPAAAYNSYGIIDLAKLPESGHHDRQSGITARIIKI